MFNSEQIILKLRQWASRLFGLSDGVFYINGPETLPPPLTKEQEEQAFAMLMTDDPKGREKLIVHNLRLVVYIAKKFETPNASAEDLISIGTIGLIKAVNTFSPEKNIKLANVQSHTVHFGNICDNGNEIDEALVIVMKAPNTYTRENIVEIDCHGGFFFF